MTNRTPAQYDWTEALFNDRRLTKHYTHPRRSKISHVTLHHMTIVSSGTDAGNSKALEGCYTTWQTREASANYGVAGDQVWQFVSDLDAPWADANGTSNQSTLAIEHANSTAGPKWEIADKTMATGQRLVATLHRLYGLGRPTRKTVKVHRDFYATACPGPYMMAHLDAYIAAAGKFYDDAGKSSSTPTSAPPKTTPATPAKPTTTALRPARAAGAAPAKLPSSMSKMYHVASNVWYAIEDSIYGLEAALAGGYPWVDIDSHVTKDGVMVCGHDTSPSDDHFVISAAMKKKYGSHPNIENMTWADVSTLRTPATKFQGKTVTLRYYRVEEILQFLGEHPSLSVSFELKQSKAFEKPATFEALRDMAAKYGVDPKRLAVMSIARPAYNHELRFKAAHAYFATIVLPHDLPKPAGWAKAEPFVDYYRGSWAK